ncbi:YpdA family putative bacillithiol disulfide reductase [Chitinophaga varians]|uniref:YpdA family putative bacillithiol disulfide reductase n=1 Tax=Chitinophaga varians TaxID=2202339 RepID=A0A847RSD8_9BACT|nr:YpdA family putative bacillithiol disulfide reductase [Chitinophaga varians]NLR63725.1 YpdA family putative bacillithiol disulfide reductase [Chitinophaga varians]
MIAAYDVLIIGGGPIGIACGLAAKRAGLSYVIIEKGCLVNSLYNYPLYMTFFSTSERLEIGGIPFVSINPKPSRPEALEYYRRVATSEALNINLFEEVRELQPNGNEYFITTTKSAYHARHVIIATGFYDIPNLLNVPGEQLPKVTHYYKDPHYYATRKVVVVGAHNSAVDAALETYRKGAQVTMVVREGEIGKRVKYWVKPDIENRIKEGSIKAYFHSTIKSIDEQSVTIDTPDGEVSFANDFVIAMTGYQPDFSLLQKAGIQLSDDAKKLPVYNPLTMETNMPHIYLAGVVCGGMDTHVWFIENSREHADKIIQSITN